MLIEFGSLSEASSSDGDQGLRVRRVGRMDGNAVKLVVEKVIDDGVQSRESKLQIFVGLRVELQLSMVLIERQVRELREGRAELDAAEAGERIQMQTGCLRLSPAERRDHPLVSPLLHV